MAKSADQDKDKDQKDDEKERDEAEPTEGKDSEGDEVEAKKAEADEDEEAKPAQKPAPKATAAKGAIAKRSAAKPLAKKAAPPPRGGSLGKSVILFVVIVGGLAGAFALLGKEEGGGGPVKPKWSAGQTVDVELTLVKTDAKDLACAAPDDIGGKHCAFEGANKAWSKGPSTDDKAVLKPYTTVDKIQFVGAGLWSDPAMAQEKLPNVRFSAKCKLKVEGTVKKVDVRWEPTGQWFPGQEWFAGSLSGCAVQAPPK